MTNSTLLKFARAKDDPDFVWRIAAAMSVHAQEIAGWALTPASQSLVQWVEANPMEAPDQMVNFVSTSGAIAANVIVGNGIVDTSAVTDADLQYTVNNKWDACAEKMFPPAPAP